MLYCFKVSRNTRNARGTVHGIKPAPDGTQPYIRRKTSYVEALQVYSSREKAEAARRCELFALDLAEKTPDELFDMLRADLDRVANFGFTISAMARISHVNFNTACMYVYRKLNPNPRIVAKFHIVADSIERVADFARDVLPENAGCGNPLKGRGGRPELYKQSPDYIRTRGKNHT